MHRLRYAGRRHPTVRCLQSDPVHTHILISNWVGTVSVSALGSCCKVWSGRTGALLCHLWLFRGAYSATWGGVLKEVEREAISDNEAIVTGVVYGLLNGDRGLGLVVGGVAGIELLKSGAVQHSSNWGYGTDYGFIILYTGISAAIGGWSILWKSGKNF